MPTQAAEPNAGSPAESPATTGDSPRGTTSAEKGVARRLIPKPSEPKGLVDDSLAQAESTAFGNGVNLKRDAAKRKHLRTEDLRDSLKSASKLLLWIFTILVLIGTLIWCWHLFTPAWLGFLSQEKLDKIQHILQSILLSGLVAGYVKRIAD